MRNLNSRATYIVLLFLMLVTGWRPARAGDTYSNPLPIDIADPNVLHYKGNYYLYGTTDTAEGFRVWTSPDMVHWESRGFAYRKSPTGWGKDHFWAPSVIERKGAFYLFYSAVGFVVPGRMSHRICLARSDSPTGPFVDVKTPLIETNRSAIDPEAFIDVDGRPYLYYSLDISENPVSEICAVALSDDLLSAVGSPVHCIRPSQPWEGTHWNEAPFVFRHNDTYILTYSANGYFEPSYGVGYATATSPLGPWIKSPRNPILYRTATVSGPGHNCVVSSPNGKELFIIYHAHKSLAGGNPRQLAIDRLSIAGGEGSSLLLTADGPSRGPRPVPSQLEVPAPVAAAPTAAE